MSVYSEDHPPPGHESWDWEDDYDGWCACGKRLEVDPPYYTYGHHLRHIVEQLPDAAWDEDEKVCDSCADGGINVHTDLKYAPLPEGLS